MVRSASNSFSGISRAPGSGKLRQCARRPSLWLPGTTFNGPASTGVSYSENHTVSMSVSLVETAEALDSVEAINTTPGLAGVDIGPSDLSLSMGHTPKLDPEEPAVIDAARHILDACRTAGVRCGIHCLAPSYANRMLGIGFDLVTLGSDIRLYSAACASAIAGART